MNNNHGGKRKGAGRKASPHPRQVLIVSGSDAELAIIRAALTTRERTIALLEAASNNGLQPTGAKCAPAGELEC